jgi:purine-binding chemotaxis protein CheW
MANHRTALPPHLIFGVQGALYAVDATAVREVLPFLALSAMEEMPGCILGVANLRGSIVPIMDLNVRFGGTFAPCRATDCIVVLQRDGVTVGMVVNEVREVRSLHPESTEWRAGAGQTKDGARFVAGVAKLDHQVVMLLDLEQLLRLSDEPPSAAAPSARLQAPGSMEGRTASRPGLIRAGSREPGAGSASEASYEATPEERVLLLERAAALAQPLERDGITGLTPVAVARLGSEFLGFELDWVLEFAAVRTVTPVPCCPPQIAGQVNLRGDIVTLVDLRPILRIPAEVEAGRPSGLAPGARLQAPGPDQFQTASRSADHRAEHRAPSTEHASAASFLVLVEIDALRFGVLVHEVLEIVPLHPAQIGAIPDVQPQRTSEYLKAAVPYRGQMLGILDLPRMVAEGSLIVDDEA